jgi:ABC-2 type transport system ATP-binding protein
MIEVEALSKDYGTVLAVRDVSFQVGRGEVVGFLGPNGAGKSTTLRIIAGYLGATSGKVRVAGHDVWSEPLKARQALGYMPEAAPLYPELRVREYLVFRASIKGVPRRERARAVERALELASIRDVAETLILHLSKGYRQRVGLADALVANPPLLVLDEPTAGLDPNQIREVRKLIRELGRDHTILLSTHILPEVETTCDRAVVIHRGRVVAEGSIEELKRRPGSRRAHLLVRASEQRVRELVATAPGVRHVNVEAAPAGLLRVHVTYGSDVSDPGAALEKTIEVLVENGLGVREAAPAKATLEDAFAALTVHEADPHDAPGPSVPPTRPSEEEALP